MRIYLARHYVMESTPGVSGFKRLDEREYRIVTGHKARLNRCDIVAEWTPMSDERYALEDGRLPEYQTDATPECVCRWLQANPYGCARAVREAHARLHGRHTPKRINADAARAIWDAQPSPVSPFGTCH